MPSKGLFDVAAIRELARVRVEETSLRAVAAEIPMSKSGLDSFLQGRNPYSATRPKLAAWYVRNKRRGSPVNGSEVEAALAVLSKFITYDERIEVRRERLGQLVAKLESLAGTRDR